MQTSLELLNRLTISISWSWHNMVTNNKTVLYNLEAATCTLRQACDTSRPSTALRVHVQHTLDLDCKLSYFAFHKQGRRSHLVEFEANFHW